MTQETQERFNKRVAEVLKFLADNNTQGLRIYISQWSGAYAAELILAAILRQSKHTVASVLQLLQKNNA